MSGGKQDIETLNISRATDPEAVARSRPRRPVALYGAKYPDISRIMCVALLAKALIDPLVVGTIARFEVIAPSSAFSVETTGRVCPCGHNVRYPRYAGVPCGTTVTLITCACAVAGIPHALALTATSRDVIAADPDGCRVSSTRHGVTP